MLKSYSAITNVYLVLWKTLHQSLTNRNTFRNDKTVNV